MFLKKASACYFRNYGQISLDFNSLINIFTGENGQGKTSFLEALYCALRGQSFQPFINTQFIQKNQKSSKICLNVQEKEGLSQIETSFFCSENRLKKEHFYCGKKVRSSFLIEKFPCFAFTEMSLKCIRQGPAERRSFVEDLFFSRNQIQVKEDFYRILKQRNQLLKNYKKALVEKEDFLDIFSILNQDFLTKSYLLVKARLQLLDHIFHSIQKLSPSFFKEPLPSLTFSYFFSEKQKITEEQEIRPLLKKNMEEKRELELQTGLTLSGPQRHEIVFYFDGEDSRTFCSKGQQRSYILALLLAHIQSFPQAFLFLDDVLFGIR